VLHSLLPLVIIQEIRYIDLSIFIFNSNSEIRIQRKGTYLEG
jgi:hypothetical protein